MGAPARQPRARRRRPQRALFFKLADQGLELGLVKELELIGREAVGAGAEALAFEQGDVVEQLLDALFTLLEGLFVLKALTLRLSQAILQSHHLGTQLEGVLWGKRCLRGVVDQPRGLCRSDRRGVSAKRCFHNLGMSRWTSAAG